MRRIAVCDDEQDTARQISAYLKQFGQETGDELQVFYYASAEELLQFMPDDVQILLLDISMGQLSGMQAARQLRARGQEELFILFITSMTEYAMEGYDVHAFAFLPKPVQYAALRRYLLEVFSRLDREEDATFLLEDGTSHCALRLSELIYIEVYQHDTCFHLAGGTRTVRVAISAVERQLAGRGFFRCHKSYLVNLRHVARMEQDALLLSDGSRIPLSRYRRKELLAAWNRCVGVKL